MHKWALLWTLANFTGILSAIVELNEVANDKVKLIALKNVSQADAKNNGSEDIKKQ